MAYQAPDAFFTSSDPSMPFPVGLRMLVVASRRPDPESEGTGTTQTPPQERLLLVLGSRLDVLMQELVNKEGQPPASKASIEAMPSVSVGEEGGECVICLEQFESGGMAKEMPCKHMFHGGCIDKWLNRHGSCPVCRYTMPVEEEEEAAKKSDDGDDGGERRRDGEISVNVYLHGFRIASEDDASNQTPSAAHHDDDHHD